MQIRAVACVSCRHNIALLPYKLTLPGGTIGYRLRRKIMIKQNKIISLAIIGLVIGGIVGVLVNSEQVSAVMLAAFGGVIGFLAGWIWNSRSGDSEE